MVISCLVCDERAGDGEKGSQMREGSSAWKG